LEFVFGIVFVMLLFGFMAEAKIKVVDKLEDWAENHTGGAWTEDGSLIDLYGKDQGKWYVNQDKDEALYDPRPHFRHVIGSDFTLCSRAFQSGKEDLIIFEYNRWLPVSQVQDKLISPIKFDDIKRTSRKNEVAFTFRNITNRSIARLDLDVDFISKDKSLGKERIRKVIQNLNPKEYIEVICNPEISLSHVDDIVFHDERIVFTNVQI
jgi:hypothetical protein